MEIIYETFIRCNPRHSYYERIFADFKAKKIHVSELKPFSPRNFPRNNRKDWKLVSSKEASEWQGEVWYKNASFYGGSRYYIKEE